MKAPVVYSRRMTLCFHLGVIEFELLFQDKKTQKTKNTFFGGRVGIRGALKKVILFFFHGCSLSKETSPKPPSSQTS